MTCTPLPIFYFQDMSSRRNAGPRVAPLVPSLHSHAGRALPLKILGDFTAKRVVEKVGSRVSGLRVSSPSETLNHPVDCEAATIIIPPTLRASLELCINEHVIAKRIVTLHTSHDRGLPRIPSLTSTTRPLPVVGR